MNATPAVLAEAFRHVRARIPRLGVGEYVALLRALEGGFAAGPGELTFLCQALWAKSPAERRQVAEVVEALLAEAAASAAELPESAAPADEYGAVPEDPGDLLQRMEHPHPAVYSAARAARADATDAAGAAGADRPETWEADVPAGVPAVLRELPLTTPFDLEAWLPVTRRQMGRAWRAYRRMGQRGAPVEVDADATIRRIHRDGVMAEPVLVPRRTNQARLLILEDTGGSMVPFRYVSAELVEAARHAGLARVDVFYFHDVAMDVVFRDPALLAPVTVEDAVGRFTDAGVLLYSDAGAARGGRDAERARRTAELLEVLRRATPNVAWLNPVPAERWRGTTADLVRRRTGVPMFPLDPGGLRGAVDHLRGLGR